MAAPWRVLYGSVTGTSHQRRGEPCQDYALARVLGCEGRTVLVAACADGAGSAPHAAVGARLACTGIVRTAVEELENALPVREMDAGRMLSWYGRVRNRLSFEACFRNADLRDFACTLLTAVVGEAEAAFSQIGDGVIILHGRDAYRPVFWPQAGEEASTTFFLTDRGFEERVEFAAVPAPVDELALLTDGLQALALHYATRTVHAPFFDPLFRSLRETPPQSLDGPLKSFLASEAVNRRTDDDKTLILATRRPPDGSP